jgi:hypothetical protein
MASIVVAGDTSGTVTLTAPLVAGTTTLTLPTTDGTVLTSATPFSNGQGPAFSAYQSSSQSINNATETKVNYQTEEWDTASCFDTSTSRFTPNLAGYYQVNARVSFTSADTRVIINLFKNGSSWKRGNDSGSASVNSGIVSALVYLDGSTDYIEIYAYQSRGSANSVNALSTETYFQGVLVRAA